MEIIRTCTKCKEKKPLSEFFNRNSIKGPIKKAGACKICCRDYAVKFYQTEKGKEQQQRAKAKYRKANPNKDSEYQKLNKVEIKLNKAKYYIANKNGIFLKYKINATNDVKELKDPYVKQRIKLDAKKVFNINVNVNDISQELIELKRIQIKTYRLCQQLQN